MTNDIIELLIDVRDLSWLLERAAGECSARGDDASERVLRLAARVSESIGNRLERVEAAHSGRQMEVQG